MHSHDDEAALLLETDRDWQHAAKRLLREEIDHRGLNYKGLMLLLEAAGTIIRIEILQARLASAAITPEFFLLCLQVMDGPKKSAATVRT